MQKMSVSERKAHIEKLRKERDEARKEIQDLEKKIAAFTAEETLKQGDNLTLDKVMQDAVVEQAKEKGFVFEK
jgi:cell division protein FtsB